MLPKTILVLCNNNNVTKFNTIGLYHLDAQGHIHRLTDINSKTMDSSSVVPKTYKYIKNGSGIFLYPAYGKVIRKRKFSKSPPPSSSKMNFYATVTSKLIQ